jgi:hypothetical protein
VKTAIVQARFWDRKDETYLPKDADLREATLTLKKVKDRPVIQMSGGPTGHESFFVDDRAVKGMSSYGWLACFGGGKYERCDVSSGEMTRAFEELGLA